MKQIHQEIMESNTISGFSSEDEINYIISSPFDVPSISSSLENSNNIGVKFIQIHSNQIINGGGITVLEIKEFANVCRLSGIRPWLKSFDNNDTALVKRFANLWINQLVLMVNPELFDWNLFEEIAKNGVFVFLSDSYMISDEKYKGLLVALTGKYANSIAIIGSPGSIERLDVLGLSEHDIKNLMVGNFERRMKAWEADSSFYDPEPWTNEERKIVKAISHRKWWLR